MKSLEYKSKLLTEQLLTSDPKKFILLEMKKIGIDKLPYSYSALDKFIDSKTMNVHYNKHYKGYVKKLNKSLSEKNYGDVELEEIIKSISRYNKTIRNNAGGAFNHALFWKMLSPKKQECKGEILKKIKKEFGDYQSFKKKFEESAKKSFGSGWIWLSLSDNGRLKIVTTPNQDNPLMNIVKSGGYPILGLDLWEHAYYLKYQSNRDSYISNFWNCVNWEFVEKLYLSRQKKKPLNENKMTTNQNYEYCPKSEVYKYQQVFNTNKKVKWDFNTAILDIFEELFPDNWYDKNEYAEGELAGLYDFRGIPGRSPINYANTNYYCYCVLLNDTNQVLSRAGIPTIQIIGKSEEEQVSENKRLIQFIRHYKERIFSENSKTFKKLIDITSRSGSRGKQGEDYTIQKIKKYFGDDNVELVGKIGSIKDAKSGVDCNIIINGEVKTGQIKPYGFIEKKDGDMVFKNTGGVESYKTDLLIFYRDNSDIYIFDNKKVKIVDGIYHAPETALLYKI